MENSDVCIELSRILRRYQRVLRLSKKLGQHIMRGCALASDFAKILQRLKPNKVLEIGTGIGSLTLVLSRFSPHVVSVEIDPKLAYIARRVLRNYHNAEIVLGDGLVFLRASSVRADIVCSNPPFNLTGPLISAIVKSSYNTALITLQKEVAEKLVSSPGTRNYGRLAAFVRTFMDVKLINTYAPEEFLPKPEVHVSLVLLSRKRKWEGKWAPYEELIKCIFNQRRKLAYKVVRKCLENVLKLRLSEWTELRELRNMRVFSLDPDLLVKIFSTYSAEADKDLER
ncbi:MAG: ribosomal RNA small subunit methyltransferase A [Desulfurococcales archaeon]|nr:ribosomal RNA small subunit methyltransferase A [Desulfurococcales archaeon]